MAEVNMFSIPPEELLTLLQKRFMVKIPHEVETTEQMQQAGNLLGVCMSNYSYLANMQIKANLIKRQIKRTQGSSKEEIEDAICREDIFRTYAEIAKNSYKAISRMITTRQQVLYELQMTDGVTPQAQGKKQPRF